MLTSGETLYLDVLQTDSAGRSELNFICAVFVLFVFVFCFPLKCFKGFLVWEVQYRSSSSSSSSFWIKFWLKPVVL